MAWPQSTDFLEAVQDLAVSMEDDELRDGEVIRTTQGLPMLWSGNFADVFKIHCPATGNTWAIKCFTRPIQGLRERYRHIAAHLERVNLSFTVDFQYLDHGICIAGEWFPVLKMRWVEGLTLNRFIESHLERPGNLQMLLDLWAKLAARLSEAQVTHADLQHGNVLLVPISGGAFALRLVDYDGMFVPALVDTRSGEVGHPAYQHPQRLRDGTYNAEVDRFSHLAIYTAIRCLMSGRSKLWERFNNDDNLLFREEDFRSPSESNLFRILWRNLPDADARSLVGRLILACKSPLEETPLLDEVLTDGKSIPLTSEQESAINAILMPLPKLPAKSDSTDRLLLEGLTLPISDPQSERPPALPIAPAAKAATIKSVFRMTLAPVRAADRFLRAMAGAENTPLHNFFRILAVLVVFGLPIGANTLYSHLRSIRERESALMQQQEMEQKESIVKAAKEAELRKQAEEESRRREAEEARKTAEAEAARKAEEAAKERLAEAEATRKKVEEELLGNTVFGETIRVFNGPPMTSVAFLPNGRQVVTGTMDGSTILWNALTGERVRVFEDHKQPVPSIAVNPEGNQLLTGSIDHTVILSDIASGNKIRVFEGSESSAFSPDGKYILTGSWMSHSATLWNAATGEQVRVLTHEPNDVVTTVAFSPDGKRILTGCGSHQPQGMSKAALWDTETGASIRSFQGHNSPVSAIFSKDAKWIITGAQDGAELWDASLNNQIQSLKYGGNSAASCVAFSPDGKRVLTGFPDSSTILWDAENGNNIHTFKGHSKYVHAVAFSPDGKRVLTGSIDGTAILWNAKLLNQTPNAGGNRMPIDDSAAVATATGRRPMNATGNTAAPEEVVVKLHPRQGIMGPTSQKDWLVDYFRPVFIPLSDTKPDGLNAEPAYRSTKPQYSTLLLGDNAKNAFVIAYDDKLNSSPRLFLDYNKDKDLTNDGGPLRWSSNGNRWTDVTINVPYKTGTNSYGIVFYRFEGHLYYYRDSARVGDIELDGKRYKIAVLEEKGTALFDDLSNDTLIIDLNQDGKLDGRGDSVEKYKADKPVNIHGKVWEIASVSPDGLRAVFRRSNAKVEDRMAKREAVDIGAREQKAPADNGKATDNVQQIRIFGWPASASAVAFSRDGTLMLVGQHNVRTIIRQSMAGEQDRVLDGQGSSSVRACAFSNDGKLALTGYSGTSQDSDYHSGAAILWDTTTGEQLRVFRVADGRGRSSASELAFSPNSPQIAIASGAFLLLLDSNTGEHIHECAGRKGHVSSVAFSPDGKQVLAGYEKKAAILWDVATGKAGRMFQGHTDSITAVAFNQRGDQILTGGSDMAAILWDANSGKQIRVFRGHGKTRYPRITSVAISPNDKYVLTSNDRTAILWNAATGEQLHVFNGYTREHIDYAREHAEPGKTFIPFLSVVHVGFLEQDADQIITGCDDATAVIWNIKGVTAPTKMEVSSEDAPTGVSNQ